MSTHAQPIAGELPPRPRRKLLTPLPVALAGLLLAALGFIGGVQVQKGQQDTATGGGLPQGLRAAIAGNAPGGGSVPDGAPRPGAGRNGGGAGGSPAPTIGEVANVKGNTLYVTDSQGNTVKVKTNAGSTVTRTAKSKVRAVRPGDQVVVQGKQNANGAVTAASVTATAPGTQTGALPMIAGNEPNTQAGGGDAVDQLFGGTP